MGDTEMSIGQLAEQLRCVPSFEAAQGTLTEIGMRLNAEAKRRWPTDAASRQKHIYGGLCALDAAYEWDVLTQPQDVEVQIYWMFAYLLAYRM